MSPKTIFTKDQLIDTAFDIANTEGFESITIRNVAKKLGCSIAPIYVNFNDVEELKSEVVRKAIGISKDMVEQQNSGDAFLDIGIASVMFAKKYPLLYDALGLNYNKHYQEQMSIQFPIELMKQNEELSIFTDEQLAMLLYKMQAFQIGLSIMAKNKQYADFLTDDVIIEMLNQTAKDIANGMLNEKGNNYEL